MINLKRANLHHTIQNILPCSTMEARSFTRHQLKIRKASAYGYFYLVRLYITHDGNYFHAVVLWWKGITIGGTPKQYRQLHGQDVCLYVLALASHPGAGRCCCLPDGENAYHDTCLPDII